MDTSSEVCGRTCPGIVDEAFAMGDSGEEPGDISVTLESSASDNVVVGDEPADSDAEVDVLSLWWWVWGK